MPDYAPCPQCGSTTATPVNWTWWGGVLGPKVLTHVKCDACGTEYNGKTGTSNTNFMVAYMVVVTVLALIIGWLLIAGR